MTQLSPSEDEQPTRLLLAVDGNSLLHRAYHGGFGSEWRDAQGRGNWALRGLLRLISSAVERLAADALVVGFDCREHSVRRAEYPAYKEGRPGKTDELRAQLADVPEVLVRAGVPVVVPHGYEADDVLASAAALARRSGWRCTVVTSDRDAFALIDSTTTVLRLLDGGVHGSPLLTPSLLRLLCGVGAWQYRDFAALRGDTSDNLPGVLGIGPKTAARLLGAFAGVDEVYAALDGGRHDEVAAVIGASGATRLLSPQSRLNVERNQRLMAMRDDLPLPPLEALHLPLDVHAMTAALAERSLSLGRALWPLTGSMPLEMQLAAQAERDAVDLPAQPAPRRPARSPAPAPAEPADEQLSLFG